MWKKTLLLVAICLTGLGSLSALLLRRDRIAEPPNLDPGRYAREDYRSIIQQVNGEFQSAWSRDAIQPVGPADLLLVARRISLGLTGTIPSLEEIRALEAQPEPLRLEWWMSRLLADRRYSDYVAERLARAFVGTDQGPFLLYRRRRFVTWLSDQLAANRPYDQLVRDLITAKGLWTDAPEVNFLTATADGNEKGQPDDIRLAGRTARAFLAIRIDCLQCHDDKLGTIELGTSDGPRLGDQADFHQLAAYYSQAHASLFGIRDGNQDYRYKYLGADDTALVIPKPPFLDELLPSAATRREQLARWVTGQPLVDPVDSIPLFGPFPPGLETLTEDFVNHGFDVQRLLRLMVATDAFRRDSQASFEITTAHERAWAVFPLTRLRPEQVAGSIIQSASLSTIDANSHILSQLGRFFQARDFVERYGDTGEDEFVSQSGTITQRLLLMNGELVKERTKENPLASAATRIAMLAPDDNTGLEAAYLAVLTRRPTRRESELWTARLAGTSGKQRQQSLEDLYWVLINSSEFSWNH
jgi:hypothetical protein